MTDGSANVDFPNGDVSLGGDIVEISGDANCSLYAIAGSLNLKQTTGDIEITASVGIGLMRLFLKF